MRISPQSFIKYLQGLQADAAMELYLVYGRSQFNYYRIERHIGLFGFLSVLKRNTLLVDMKLSFRDKSYIETTLFKCESK